MSKGEILKLREIEVDAAIALQQCNDALAKASDAKQLAMAERDRAQIAYANASKASNKAQGAIFIGDTKEGKADEQSGVASSLQR